MAKKFIPIPRTPKVMQEELDACEIAISDYDRVLLAKNKEIKDYRKMLKTVAECVRVPGGLVDSIETLLKKYKP